VRAAARTWSSERRARSDAPYLAAESGCHSAGAVLVGRDQVLAAPPLARAPELLAGLLDLYWQGLSRPLKFFPQTALAYTEAALARETGRSKSDPASAARLTWEGNPFTRVPGECEDAYFDLCFRNTDPLDEEFQQAARAVFEPLLAELKEVEP
jgi:exodeoxyribonuclease V gamma subunit